MYQSYNSEMEIPCLDVDCTGVDFLRNSGSAFSTFSSRQDVSSLVSLDVFANTILFCSNSDGLSTLVWTTEVWVGLLISWSGLLFLICHT